MEDNYKPSKEFTDHAWSEMKALLDEELPDKGAILFAPNQEKSKKFLLLLSLLLLFTIAALFFYYQAKSNLSDELTTGVKTNSELVVLPLGERNDIIEVKTENTAGLEENSETAIVAIHHSNDNTPKKTGIETTKVNSNINKVNYKTYNEPRLTNDINSAKILFEAPIFIRKEVENELKEEISRPLTPVFDKNSKPLKEVEKKIKDVPKPIALVQPIKREILSLLEFDEEKPNVEEFSNIKGLKNRLPIYAFVGARNYDLSAKVDFVAGIETVLGKINKKVGLRTGINYAQRSTTYLTKEESIATVSLMDMDANFADLLEMPVGNSALFYEARAELNANPIKYHFLEIPLFLDFRLSKKWSLHSGLSVKGLFYSSSQNFGLLNGIRGRNRGTMASAQAAESNSQDYSTSYFAPRRFNLGAAAGLNFNATQRLGLQARFSQNLFDVYSELPAKQHSNSLELGLSWRLK